MDVFACKYGAKITIHDRNKEKITSLGSGKEIRLILKGSHVESEKYGYTNSIHYTIGPGEPINKSFDEFIKWLQEMYDAGRYKEIHYGVWFDLDEEVIPKEYLSKFIKSNKKYNVIILRKSRWLKLYVFNKQKEK